MVKDPRTPGTLGARQAAVQLTKHDRHSMSVIWITSEMNYFKTILLGFFGGVVALVLAAALADRTWSLISAIWATFLAIYSVSDAAPAPGAAAAPGRALIFRRRWT